MSMPMPTPIVRFTHIDNLPVYLRRGCIHAPNCVPDDGLIYRTIHNEEIQSVRHRTEIPCGPGGVIHDYVPFYFGYLSPMLFQLHTGQVQGYSEGQRPLIYLISTIQKMKELKNSFVFSDGHGIARITNWYDNLERLHTVDWQIVNERYWADDHEKDMDRQRRKQAEFLVYRSCSWSAVLGIAVIDSSTKIQVENILQQFPTELRCPVYIKPNWYY